ncbi:hypothetical protein TIFTF001_002986 [Ficus carica]|uniref:Uncharacterized protein n=1 Tax=Ficus carica TaxID=3494 RepID=A0AA87Z9G2_FICCA|nr:hypothetical protein TIFTF001_002986 [Ficus carica]
MPRLVQVTVEQAQIPEDNTTKSRDSESGNRNPKEIAMNLAIPTLLIVSVVNTRECESSSLSVYLL